jgi:serpin B
MKKLGRIMRELRRFWRVLPMVGVACMMAGCDDSENNVSPEENERKSVSLTRSEQELVTANNDFAFNLFRVADAQNSTILSPISITYALGMLNNGAAGDTQAQINKVLGFGETGAEGINAFCKKMLTEAPNLDKSTKVLISNTIYMNKGYELKPLFVSKANDCYHAEPETRNFADGKTLDVINQWASDHTEKMIEKVLDKDSFDPSAISYLLNAIYFKGAWTEKFDKENTRDEAFKMETGEEKQLPIMHQEQEFYYAEDDDCQVLRLPYGNKAYSMTILLPKEGKTVRDLVKTLNKDTWERYQRIGSAIVDVKLPRFESNTDLTLDKIMATLGMPNAFNPNLAEFPEFCNVPTYIDMMKQVARIKVNEEGTEAAAVTVIFVKLANAAPRRVSFHATRPFLYIISEQSTGAIFFIGQFMGD